MNLRPASPRTSRRSSNAQSHRWSKVNARSSADAANGETSMNETDRRDVLRNAGLAVTAAAIGDPLVSTQAQAQAPRAALKQAELPNDLTRKLARFIISARLADMPEAVRHEAKRTLLNWVG